MWAVIFLGVCTVVDLKKREIPVWLMILGSVAAVVFRLAFWGNQTVLWFGGILTGLFFLVVSRWTGEGFGYGDSWMILILGIYLGLWNVLWLLCIAFAGAGITAVVLLAKGNWSRKISFPFIPFLFLGYVGVLCL